LIPNPIRKVLSTLSTHEVRCLLMGGQACVLYGGAEFSRDTDLVVLSEPANLDRLRAAMRGLRAERIAVPDLSQEHLQRGHAVHFRCRHPDVDGIRIDVMSVLRGVAPFEDLWRRRTTVTLDEGPACEVLALPDLVRAKKTQRDKDWPMIRRLIEAHYAQHQAAPSEEQVDFWFAEARTPSMLIDLAERFPERAHRISCERSAVAPAINRDADAVEAALEDEERHERHLDRQYWKPLRTELEAMRHAAARRGMSEREK